MRKINVPIALMSVIVSVLLWYNVFSAKTKPTRTQSLSIKLTTSNLDESKFTVSDAPDDITVTIAGTSEQIRDLSNLPPTAIVDLFNAAGGTRNYPVQIFPAKVREVLVNSAITARVKIEPLMTKKVEVEVARIGRLPSPGIIADESDTFPKSVSVTGPVDAVQKVSKVLVTVDLNSGVTSPDGLEVEAKPVDATGKLISRLMVTFNEANPKYNEENLAKPFMVRVRIRTHAGPPVGPPR